MTPDYFEAVARAHEAGRRLYVGTANVDTRRFVISDMGAIAARRTPAARELYRRVILASTTFPGFLAPVPIAVDIDGCRYEEFHVDGGTARTTFFHPPVDPTTGRPIFGPHALDHSDLYVVVAGKIYADPVGTPPQVWSVLLRSASTLLDSGTRSELFRVFAYAMYAGANYYQMSIPEDFGVPAQSMQFDPEVMTPLFLEGYNRARCGWPALWETSPPELDPRESRRTRLGTCLTTAPLAPPVATAAPQPRRTGPRPSPRLPSSIVP